LRRLILAVADDGDTARAALHEELRCREIPLQVIVDPQTGGTQLRSWPGGVQALPIYADEVSLLTSARDHGMKLGTFAAAVMPPLKLFGWAAGNSWAIAMNAFRTADQPVYVVLTSEEVKALAQGRMPSSSPGAATWQRWGYSIAGASAPVPLHRCRQHPVWRPR
jgi:hypothetical protein